MNKTRKNGQIWIDKNPPHNLKYFIDGTEFLVETSPSYQPMRSDATLYAGTVVKIDDSSKSVDTIKVTEASFPADASKVIGVIKSKYDGASDSDKKLEVIQEGTIIISVSDFKMIFVDSSKEAFKAGDPIYWDYTGTSGKLIRNLPASEIEYSGLPQIGNISKIDKNNIYIHLNFSEFSRKIFWKKTLDLSKVTPGEGGIASIPINIGKFSKTADNTLSDLSAIINPNNCSINLPYSISSKNNGDVEIEIYLQNGILNTIKDSDNMNIEVCGSLWV